MRSSLIYFLAVLCLGLSITAAWMSKMAHKAALQAHQQEQTIAALKTDVFAARLETGQSRSDKVTAQQALKKAIAQASQDRNSHLSTQAALKRSNNILAATRIAKTASEHDLRDAHMKLAQRKRQGSPGRANATANAKDKASLQASAPKNGLNVTSRDVVQAPFSPSSAAIKLSKLGKLTRNTTKPAPILPTGLKTKPKLNAKLKVDAKPAQLKRVVKLNRPAAKVGSTAPPSAQPKSKIIAPRPIVAKRGAANVDKAATKVAAATIVRTIASRLNVRAKPSLQATLIKTLIPARKFIW